MAISKAFLKAIRTSELPIFKIAHQAGISPGTLYKITCGLTIPEAGDERVIAVGRVLKLKKDQLFE